MQPRTLDRDVDLARASGQFRDVDEALVELEQLQEIDEVALEEAPPAEVFQLARTKAQPAEPADLLLDFGDIGREVDPVVAALEAVLDLRTGEVMQDDLHHGELVEVGVEQRLDDHRGNGRRGDWRRHVTAGSSAGHAGEQRAGGWAMMPAGRGTP